MLKRFLKVAVALGSAVAVIRLVPRLRNARRDKQQMARDVLTRLLGFPESVSVGHLADEFSDAPPTFGDLYELRTYAIWSVDEQIYEMQDDWIFDAHGDPQQCAFCEGTAEKGNSFKSISHAIPENLGNKRVISREECDGCNGKYSACEGELAVMLAVERVFGGVRGKRGPASVEASAGMSIEGKGFGRAVKISVDGGDLKDIGQNTLALPFEKIEFKPLLAIRSLLRSAWLISDSDTRAKCTNVREIAMGTGIAFPLPYIAAFTPGMPPPLGRFRVWCLKDLKPAENWPPLVVAMSLFNTTIIWRAPTQGGYGKGPLPPIPDYGNGQPQIERIQISNDERVAISRTLTMYYEKKTLAPLSGPLEKTIRAPNHNLQELKAKKRVRLAIAPNGEQPSRWIDASLQVRKISGDLNRIVHTVIVAPQHGVRMWIKARQAGGDDVKLDFSASGLSPTAALEGLCFCEAYFKASPQDHLMIEGDVKMSLPLTQPVSGQFDANQMRLDFQAFADLERKLATTFTIPQAASSADLELLRMAATAVVRGAPIRLRQKTSVEILLSNIEFERLSGLSQGCVLQFDGAQFPFAGIPELTEQCIGPIVLQVELANAAKELAAAETERGPDSVTVRINVDAIVFVFKKFVPN